MSMVAQLPPEQDLLVTDVFGERSRFPSRSSLDSTPARPPEPDIRDISAPPCHSWRGEQLKDVVAGEAAELVDRHDNPPEISSTLV